MEALLAVLLVAACCGLPLIFAAGASRFDGKHNRRSDGLAESKPLSELMNELKQEQDGQ